MRDSQFCFRSVVFGWYLFLAAPFLMAQPNQPKVLLIGIDGLRSDAFRQASTPNLDQLASTGRVDLATSVIAENVTQSDTVSGPGWTTFLTGTWADQHGVVDNSFKGRNSQAAPHAFAIAKRAQPALRTASFVTWAPIDEFITTDADINVIVTAPRRGPEKKETDYPAADRLVAKFAVETLRTDPVDFAFVYFGAVDESGHAHGFHPSVPDYVQQIEETDELVGQVLQAVKDRESASEEDWMFVVSSDHGGEGTGHGGGRETPTVRTAPMIVSGGRLLAPEQFISRRHSTTDVIAVALAHLGIAIDSTNVAGKADGWLQP